MEHILDFFTIFTNGGLVLLQERYTSPPLSIDTWTTLINTWIQQIWIPGQPQKNNTVTLNHTTFQWHPHLSFILLVGYPKAMAHDVPPLERWFKYLIEHLPLHADVWYIEHLHEENVWKQQFRSCVLQSRACFDAVALASSIRHPQEAKFPSSHDAVPSTTGDGKKETTHERSTSKEEDGMSETSMSSLRSKKKNAKSKFTKKEKEPTSTQKPPRQWDSTPLTTSEAAALDYSDPAPPPAAPPHPQAQPRPPPASPASAPRTPSSAPAVPNRFTRFLTTTFSTTRTMTRDDLSPLLATLQAQLLAKNVAQEVTSAVLDAVTGSLVGQQVGWQSLRAHVASTMTCVCARWLMAATGGGGGGRGAAHMPLADAIAGKVPYVLAVVGVNGVGKSTSLAKVAWWCLTHARSVLLVACDTFRSGAIEQLKTHGERLSAFGKIEVFAKEYGKDPARIAKEGVQYAKAHGFQVVLIDTAGRMQNNQPLMRALAKLIALNQPDRVLFVGEATAGNTSIDQITKFNEALLNYTPPGHEPREIDAFILTKFDIIGDQVGSVLNLTYKTNKPILFVGTGQTYTDLKTLDVASVVNTLLNN